VTISAGEKRRRQARRDRLREANEAKEAELRAAGASCATCNQFSPYPGPGPRGAFICDRLSNFHGYALANADGLCVHWKVKPA